MKARLALIVAVAASLAFWGCNLFSPFHSEGSSDDPQVLLEEARAALRDNRPKDALALLDRAMQSAPQNYNVRYFHAVATVRANNVSFSSFINMMQDAGGTSGLPKTGVLPGPNGEVDLFDFPEAELRRLLQIFQTVNIDLEPVVQGLIDGTIDPADFPYADDAFLSCGVAALVSGFILMLDNDHDPTTGFNFDSRIAIKKIEDTYQVFIDDPDQAQEQIEQEIKQLICTVYPWLEDGLKCLWQYYNYATFGQYSSNDGPVPPAPLPARIQDTPSGMFFKIVHTGLSALNGYAECRPMP